ncbi:DUF6612 family protein [Gemelliphila palaticanis]|uniref:Lipoprotein n=1 Tax=Gemelliphila palaticanis TaxID=81950 RepID=A0ABX2T064_9BACL|nr:DUF6612 family protein [Gemella palaticanis]MBF0716108.1 hypothetical protein [Gemella palaticanis]NYS48038.1 hypothetical protein [Gemella palaticanis]
MKNLKRKLAIALLSGITLITTACGSSVSNEEVIKKVYESANNIKSADIELDLDMELALKDQSLKTSMKGKTSFISEPLAMSMDVITTAFQGEMKIKAYFKDNYMYISNPVKEGEWIKTDNEQLVKQIQEQQKNLTSDKIVEIFKNSSDKIKVDEKDGKYHVTYSGDGSEYKDIFITALSSTIQDPAALENIKNNTKFKKVNVTYVVDKNNYTPIEQKVDMELEITEAGNTANTKIKGTTKYSNVNNVKEIVLPEEAKNAKSLEELEKEQQEQQAEKSE